MVHRLLSLQSTGSDTRASVVAACGPWGRGASVITAQRLTKLWLLGSRVLWPTGFSCLRHAESSQIRDPQCPLHGLAGSYPQYHREVLAPPILTPRLHLDQNGKVGRGQDGLGRPQVTICVAPYSQQRGHWQFLTHWFSNRYLSNTSCMPRLVLSARDTALNKIIEFSALLELMGYWGHGQSMCKTMICRKSNTATCPQIAGGPL